MPKHSKADALAVAAELGWRNAGRNGSGYIKLLCPCGKHKKWLKNTPSDPSFFKNASAYMRRQPCSKRSE